MLNLKQLLGFRSAQTRDNALTLLNGVVRISRRPGFFGAERLPDSFEGRLELVIAHAALAVLRLRRDPADAALAQEFIDAFFKYLDASLREAGVGDLTVPKRMKKLAGGFYGRLKAYEEGLEAEDGSLEAALIRNALGPQGAGFAPTLAAHLRAAHARLQGAAIPALLDEAFWDEAFWAAAEG